VYRGGSISVGLASNTNRSGARRTREKNVSGLSAVGFRLNGVVRSLRVSGSNHARSGRCSSRYGAQLRTWVSESVGFRLCKLFHVEQK